MILINCLLGYYVFVIICIFVSSERNANNDRKRYFWRKLKMYFMNQAISLDVLVNSLVGGSPRETISSRMGKQQDGSCKFCGYLCWVLDKIDPAHCAKSVDPYRGERDVWKL